MLLEADELGRLVLALSELEPLAQGLVGDARLERRLDRGGFRVDFRPRILDAEVVGFKELLDVPRQAQVRQLILVWYVETLADFAKDHTGKKSHFENGKLTLVSFSDSPVDDLPENEHSKGNGEGVGE